jgi:hypothetical protein
MTAIAELTVMRVRMNTADMQMITVTADTRGKMNSRYADDYCDSRYKREDEQRTCR